MRCRRLKHEIDGNVKKTTVVWFGSYGKNPDGTAKFYNDSNKHDNFSEAQEAIADSLNQRLSVLKNELWYNVSYGLPLLDKIKSKITLDSFVASTIGSHPDVIAITNFTSTIQNKKYSCFVEIESKFGKIDLNL